MEVTIELRQDANGELRHLAGTGVLGGYLIEWPRTSSGTKWPVYVVDHEDESTRHMMNEVFERLCDVGHTYLEVSCGAGGMAELIRRGPGRSFVSGTATDEVEAIAIDAQTVEKILPRVVAGAVSVPGDPVVVQQAEWDRARLIVEDGLLRPELAQWWWGEQALRTAERGRRLRWVAPGLREAVLWFFTAFEVCYRRTQGFDGSFNKDVIKEMLNSLGNPPELMPLMELLHTRHALIHHGAFKYITDTVSIKRRKTLMKRPDLMPVHCRPMSDSVWHVIEWLRGNPNTL